MYVSLAWVYEGQSHFYNIQQQKYFVEIIFHNLLINPYISANIGTWVTSFKHKK